MAAWAGFRMITALAASCAPCRVFVAVLAGLVSVTVIAREPDAAEYRSFELPHYTLLAPDAAIAGRVATLLGEGERILAHLLGHEARATNVAATVLVLSSADLDRYFGGKHAFTVAPYQNFSRTILIPIQVDTDRQRAAVFHQAAHHFLQSQFHAEIPVWFGEGLALFMEPTRPAGTNVVIGEPRFPSGAGKGHRELLDRFSEAAYSRQPHAGQNWYALGDLLAARADSPVLASNQSSYFMRSECWLLVHKAFIDDPEFRESMFGYLKAVNSFTPIDIAVSQNFGMSIADLDRILQTYSQRNSLAQTTIAFTSPIQVAIDEGRMIPAAAMLERMANLALDSGAEPRHLDELIAAAEARGLDSPRVQLLLLRLAARKGNDAVLDRMLSGLAPNLEEPAIARAAGLALYERGFRAVNSGSAPDKRQQQRLARSQDLFGRVLASEPDDAEAAWIYGVIAVRLSRDLDGALSHLEHARRRQPENPDVAATLATIHFMRNEQAPMVARLEETLRYSRSPEQRRWAARQLAAANSSKKEPAGR